MNPRALYDQLVVWLDSGGDAEPYVIKTSGSTGEPKNVVLSRAALLASATATQQRLGGPGQWLLTLPTTSVAGLQVLVRSVLAGTQPVFAEEYESFEKAVAALTAPRSYTALVPTQLHRLIRDGQAGLLKNFDAVLIGGAAISPTLITDARGAGIKVVRTYGMTETSGGCVYDGVPLDGVEVDITDEGRIKIKGPVLFSGYGGVPFDDDWFLTEDLGQWNEDGTLSVIGRIDDVVISGGINIALPAVKNALLTVADVEDAEVLGVDDAEWGTRLVAVVVGDVSLEQLRDGVEQFGLPRTWAPKEIFNVIDIPTLPGGKTDRQALRRLVEQ